MLEIQNISLGARLQKISLAIDDPGVCIIGPSGSGKTSLLKSIAGLVDADEGAILLDGVNIKNIPLQKRQIAYITQDPCLLPHLKVKHAITYGLHNLNVPRDTQTQRMFELSQVFQIEHLLNRYPITLSGGEAQRVNIVRALIRQPKVLLLDEPFSSLDLKLTNTLKTTIRAFMQEHHILPVWVSHDQKTATEFEGQIIFMQKGKLIEVGSAHDLYYCAKNLETSLFFGEPETECVSVIVENGKFTICQRDYFVNLEDGEYTLCFRKNWFEVSEGNIPVSMHRETFSSYNFTVDGIELMSFEKFDHVSLTLKHFNVYKNGKLVYTQMI